mgnify:CR=1 FL=1
MDAALCFGREPHGRQEQRGEQHQPCRRYKANKNSLHRASLRREAENTNILLEILWNQNNCVKNVLLEYFAGVFKITFPAARHNIFVPLNRKIA